MYDNDKLQEEFAKARVRNGWTYNKMAEKLEVSESYLHKLIKGKKKFSKKIIEQFCEVFGYKIQEFIIKDKKEYNYGNALYYALKIRGKNLVDLMDVTGIGILDLSDYKRGKRLPPERERKLIADALEMKEEMFDDGYICTKMDMLRQNMKDLFLDPDTTEEVLQLIERNIRKPPTLK